jgi:hypothetical protein
MKTLESRKEEHRAEKVTERLFAVEERVRGWRLGVPIGHFCCSVLFTDNRIVVLDRGRHTTPVDMLGADALGCVLGQVLSSVILDILSHDVPTIETGIEVQSSELDRVIGFSYKSFSVLYSDVLEGSLKKGGSFGESSLVLHTFRGEMTIQGLDTKSLASALSSLMKGKLEIRV